MSMYRTTKSHKRQISTETPQHLPAFWDNLSQVHLTSCALKEHNRRIALHAGLQRPDTRDPTWLRNRISLIPVTDYLHRCGEETLRKIKQTAKRGGLDLLALRQFTSHRVMSSRTNLGTPKRKKLSKSTTRATSDTTSDRSIGPYDGNFLQNLIDGGVFPPFYTYPGGQAVKKPNNWDEIMHELVRPRPSLSPSISQEDYETFVQADADAVTETQVTTVIIRMIEGKIDDSKCCSGGEALDNLDHLTDGTLTPGKPDIYHGARAEQLDQRVREQLCGLIMPSIEDCLPICPNFFVAVKGPDESLAVATQQATYDGALGARGIASLQTYQQPHSYDGNAYTITCTYHGGTLKMYTSHRHKSSDPDSLPVYSTHQLNTWGMTGNVKTFVDGVTAYRNARDWAKKQRNEAIERANNKIGEQPMSVREQQQKAFVDIGKDQREDNS